MVKIEKGMLWWTLDFSCYHRDGTCLCGSWCPLLEPGNITCDGKEDYFFRWSDWNNFGKTELGDRHAVRVNCGCTPVVWPVEIVVDKPEK